MAPREKISFGRFSAEGPQTTRFIMIGGAVLLAIGFFTGQWATLLNSCFGTRF
jgi:hypothetical protein